MFSILLIRPGLTDFDLQNRVQGALDLPLCPEGERELETLTAALDSSGVEIVYCSANDPAKSTALRVGAALGIPVKELEGLANTNLGFWQGLTIDEIKRKFPTAYRQWKESPDCVCPPGGESAGEAIERAMKSLARPLRREIPFALVVCEPLATLLSCVLRRSPHALPSTYCCKERPPLLEVLRVSNNSDGIQATPVSSS